MSQARRFFTFRILVVLLLWSRPATAQPLGTFRWQIQPYCNVLTINVTQQTGVYTLDGTDDQCLADTAAGVVGVAFQNPNGSIGFGLNVVLPGGTPVHVEATIAPTSLNGTWRDSVGNSGTLLLTRGPGTGGPSRPVPSGGIAPASVGATQIAPNSVSGSHVVNGSLTSADLAAGTIGSVHLAPNSVSAAQVIDGTLTSVDLAPGIIGSAQLAPNSVSGNNVVDGSLSQADFADRPRILSTLATSRDVDQFDRTVTELTFDVPAPGRVLVNVSGMFEFGTEDANYFINCSIASSLNTVSPYTASARGIGADFTVPFGGTRTFAVVPGPKPIFFICRTAFPGVVRVVDAALTVLYVGGS